MNRQFLVLTRILFAGIKKNTSPFFFRTLFFHNMLFQYIIKGVLICSDTVKQGFLYTY